MKKEVVIVFLLILSSISYAQELEQDPGLLPDSPLYILDKTVDDVKLNLASQEDKAQVASEIHDERIAETQALAQKGATEHIEKALVDAQEKIEIINEEVTPEISESISESARKSVEVLSGVKDRVPQEASEHIEDIINRQIVSEKKTEIASEITRKIDQLCSELIELVGLEAALEEEPRCNPDVTDSPKWLRKKVREEYKDFDESAKRKFVEEMKICFNDPRQCRCSEIPIKKFSNLCFEIIPYEIKCRFEGDEEACTKSGEIGGSDGDVFEDLPQDVKRELFKFMEQDFEEEGFKRHAPRECIEAGATTRQECEKIMMAKYMPEPCREAGVTTRQECERIMFERFAPAPCKEAGVTTRSDCERIMRELYSKGEFEYFGEERRGEGEGFGPGPTGRGTPQECLRDGRFIGVEECQRVMSELSSRFSARQPPPQEDFLGQPTQEFRQPENIPENFDAFRDSPELNTIPTAVVFKDGQADVITHSDIQNIVQDYQSQTQEINTEQLRQEIYNDINTLEVGSSTLDYANTQDAAVAIEQSVSSFEQDSTTSSSTQDFSSPPSAPLESPSSSEGSSSSGGESSSGDSGSAVTGSFVLDFMNYL